MRYDVVYSSKDSYPVVPYLVPHFCRCIPCDDTHGFTFEEGKEAILDWLEQYKTHIMNYLKEEDF